MRYPRVPNWLIPAADHRLARENLLYRYSPVFCIATAPLWRNSVSLQRVWLLTTSQGGHDLAITSSRSRPSFRRNRA
jgi:hypothetical protein